MLADSRAFLHSERSDARNLGHLAKQRRISEWGLDKVGTILARFWQNLSLGEHTSPRVVPGVQAAGIRPQVGASSLHIVSPGIARSIAIACAEFLTAADGLMCAPLRR